MSVVSSSISVQELQFEDGSLGRQEVCTRGRTWIFHDPAAEVWARRPHLQHYAKEQLRCLARSDAVAASEDFARFAAEVEAAGGPWYLKVKRIIDVVGALVGLILFFPLFVIVALLIKLSDGGPVFYIHKRVGFRGKEFTCYKFRSMRIDADRLREELLSQNRHSDHRTFKMENDPRVTWIGRCLRRTSLDELPQLFNVLLGDLSLVGPRPPIPAEVARYTLHDLRRFEVKPGLTCTWQVSGRSRIPFDKQIQMDCKYMQERSMWLDLKLIVATIPAVLSADGAC
jgi:lipopolysaccharide/colanic/teichoic acid biosynthesis glycosyltransferase